MTEFPFDPRRAELAAMGHRRKIRLPDGYSVEFAMLPNETVAITWRPRLPGKVRSARARRRLVTAYRKARDEFLGELATMGRVPISFHDPLAEDDPAATDSVVRYRPQARN